MFGPLFRYGFLLVCCATQLLPDCAARTNRQWSIGGRYNGSKLIVYFDTVDLNGRRPVGQKMDAQANDAFASPEALSPEQVKSLRRGVQSKPLAVGDRLSIWAGGPPFTAKVDTLVGAPVGEEEAYELGALAHPEQPERVLRTDFYVVARHREGSAVKSDESHGQELQDEALSRPTQAFEAQISAELTRRMKALTSQAVREKISILSPALSLRPFRLSDGKVQYYAVAQWIDSTSTILYNLGAWLSAIPSMRVLAVEPPGRPDEGDPLVLPSFLQSFPNLGGNRTAILMDTQAFEGLQLLLYRDGKPTNDMTCLADIPALAD